MKTIGLTGGIGAGKGEVAAVLRAKGAEVVDADQEGHQTYNRGSTGWDRIIALFGRELLDTHEEIDRKRLGQLVFASREAMAQLNAAIHPLIKEALRQRLHELEQAGHQVAVIEAAVLLEAGWDSLVDEVWLVRTPRKMAVARVVRQRGLTEAEIRQRMASQADDGWKVARSDVVLDNPGSLEELHQRVDDLWAQRIHQEG